MGRVSARSREKDNGKDKYGRSKLFHWTDIPSIEKHDDSNMVHRFGPLNFRHGISVKRWNTLQTCRSKTEHAGL
jgi:hypothetical protein